MTDLTDMLRAHARRSKDFMVSECLEAMADYVSDPTPETLLAMCRKRYDMRISPADVAGMFLEHCLEDVPTAKRTVAADVARCVFTQPAVPC